MRVIFIAFFAVISGLMHAKTTGPATKNGNENISEDIINWTTDYRMHCTEWPRKIPSESMQMMFDAMPLNISVLKLKPEFKTVGFRWADDQVVILQ